MTLTATKTLKNELAKIQQAQTECITDQGFVRSECRYRYQILVRKANSIRESIKWLEELYASPSKRG